MLPDPIFLNVHMYGIMIAVGVLCALGLLFLLSKKLSAPSKLVDFVYYAAIISIFVGFGFAALFHSIYYYIENPERGFIFGDGYTFLAGFIFGALFFFGSWIVLRKKIGGSILTMVPILPCCITIGHAFGRFGCFFAGCCYGKETDSFLGVKFPNLLNKVHPTQLYEAVFLLALCLILCLLLIEKKNRHTMSIYLISYGVFRFLIEFIRDDKRGSFVGSMSPSQFWSLVIIVVGVGLIFFMDKFSKNVFPPIASEDAVVIKEDMNTIIDSPETTDNDTDQ